MSCLLKNEPVSYPEMCISLTKSTWESVVKASSN